MFKIDFNNQVLLSDMNEINSKLSNRDLLFNKSIYITGASGMIASYCVAYLIWLNEKYDANIQIYAGIRSAEKASNRFGEYVNKSYFHLISSDVIIPVPESLHFNYIIHAASLASPQYYGSMPVETMLPNVIGTYNLLDYAKRERIDSYLFFSSGSVYGSIGGIDAVTEESIGTFDFLAKGNVYGESKRCGETMCRAYFNEFGVPTKMARIHHTYGPTADIDNDTRVFSEFANNIVQNKNIVLKSAGDARRAFCYIADSVIGLFTILLSGINGESYNIGNPNEYMSIAELAECLVNLFPEKQLHVIKEKRDEAGYSASPEKRIVPVSVHKLIDLGWRPEVTIQEGFKRMIQAIEAQI